MNIPAGVIDGQRIRLAGQGGRGGGGAHAGDLYLIVRHRAAPPLPGRGPRHHVLLPLAPWEAALGASVAVDTPGGEAKVSVPAGTSSGRRLRLRGRGLPNPRGKPGDLYAEVRIMVPHALSDGGAASCSSSSPRSRPSTRGGGDDRDDHRDPTGTRWPLARPYRLSLDSYARITGVHPELVRRLVALGLLEIARDAAGRLLFAPPSAGDGPDPAAARCGCPSTTRRSAW